MSYTPFLVRNSENCMPQATMCPVWNICNLFIVPLCHTDSSFGLGNFNPRCWKGILWKNIALYLLAKYPALGQHWGWSSRVEASLIWPRRTVLVPLGEDWLNAASQSAPRGDAPADGLQGTTAWVNSDVWLSPFTRAVALTAGLIIMNHPLRYVYRCFLLAKYLSRYVHSPQRLIVIFFSHCFYYLFSFIGTELR